MPNTISVHQMLARDGAAILEEEAPFLRSINRGRDGDFQGSISGYRKGEFVDISVPFAPVVFDGATFAGGSAAPDMTETKVRLQLDIQKHTAITVTSVEKALKMESERERIMRPAMAAISADVEAVMLSRAYQATANLVGTYGTIPTSAKTYSQARALLNKFLAPNTDRKVIFSNDANVELVEASKALFNNTTEISKQFLKGAVGMYAGMDFMESNLLAVHTNGNQASWTVSGAGQTGTTLNIGSLTSGQIIRKGTTFTCGVFATNPVTGDSYGSGTLRRFVVTADFTASGTTGAISIFPAITPTTGALVGTVNASPANGATCALDGAASALMTVGLAFQKDAFAAAFAPLELVPGTEGYTASLNGFSVRVMKGGSFTADTSSTRVDVLCGFAAVRPDHAVRLPG